MNDLERLKRLEEELGIKLDKRNSLAFLMGVDYNCYFLNSNNQVVGLNLDDCRLTELPEVVCGFKFLQGLSLFGNQLTSLPESIGNLTALTDLNLAKNKMSSLPGSLGNLKALRKLELWYNRLTSLPESLSKLTALKKLTLEYNHLSNLPDWLDNLKAEIDLGEQYPGPVTDRFYENRSMITEGRIPKKTKRHLDKYVDTKDPLKVLEYLQQQSNVDVSLIGEGSIEYDDVYITVKVGNRYVTYWWYDMRGEKSAEDLGLVFDLNAVRLSEPKERTVIEYHWTDNQQESQSGLSQADSDDDHEDYHPDLTCSNKYDSLRSYDGYTPEY
jgi:Leucine-rich repeat (LRR) protein